MEAGLILEALMLLLLDSDSKKEGGMKRDSCRCAHGWKTRCQSQLQAHYIIL